MDSIVIDPCLAEIVGAHIEGANASSGRKSAAAIRRRDALVRDLPARQRDMLAVMGSALKRLADNA